MNESYTDVWARLVAAGKQCGLKEEVLENIKSALGGTNVDALYLLEDTDLTEFGIPVLSARVIVKAIKGNQPESWTTSEERKIVVVSDDPVSLAARMKPADLVGEYDPNDPDNPFGARLKLVSNNQPFLVFDSNGAILRAPSIELLQEIRDGFPPRATVIFNGKLTKTFRVGERPLRYADEHPLVPGGVLRPGGWSDGNIQWGTVAKEIRQLLFIATRNTNEAAVVNEKHIFFDQLPGKSFDEIAVRYPAAALKFEELRGSNQLPEMKVALGNVPPAK